MWLGATDFELKIPHQEIYKIKKKKKNRDCKPAIPKVGSAEPKNSVGQS
jgi:hypothetical protein